MMCNTDEKAGHVILVLVAASAATLATAGCGHGARLVPDRSAKVILGADTAAVASAGGVRCSADGGSWQGIPEDLASEVMPVKVRIQNHSGRPIRLLYERFALVGTDGRSYRPIPPVPLPAPGTVTQTVHPVYTSQNFFVAPRLHQIYRSLEPWSQQLERDSRYYARSYARWNQDLPSRDMLQKAMPEGVLADGGVISGFLYFDGNARHEDRLMFQADVPEGDTDAQVALINIPFRVE